MTEFDEAEIKEHHAPLMRQLVATAITNYVLDDVGGTASLIRKHGKG